MSQIDREDVVGTQLDAEMVCVECMSGEEWRELKLSDLLTRDDVERDDDKLYFCDRCKVRLRP